MKGDLRYYSAANEKDRKMLENSASYRDCKISAQR